MPRPIEPGTVVRINTGQMAVRRGSPAILVNMRNNGLVRLITDAGTATVVRDQITVPKTTISSFVPMRLRLAYGLWTEGDGSKVLFSRDYCPMWRISVDGSVSQEEPWRWIRFVHQEEFWDDARPPWRDRSTELQVEKQTAEFGVTGLPKLMNVLRSFIAGEAGDNDGIRDIVRRMAPAGEPIHVY